MNKTILITATILGILGISLGAFAAHGLRDLISADSISSFETGVRYQIFYALLLMFVANTKLVSYKIKKAAYYSSLTGVLLFSGSIYALATNDLTTFDFKKIALLTPLGGLLLIGVWVILLVAFIKMPSAKMVKK